MLVVSMGSWSDGRCIREGKGIGQAWTLGDDDDLGAKDFGPVLGIEGTPEVMKLDEFPEDEMWRVEKGVGWAWEKASTGGGWGRG